MCLFFLQSTVDQKRASHHESNGFAGRIHLLPDLLQQSHSSSTSSTSSSPSSSQPTPTMSPQTPQDKLTANEVGLAHAGCSPRLDLLPGRECAEQTSRVPPLPSPPAFFCHLLSSPPKYHGSDLHTNPITGSVSPTPQLTSLVSRSV